MDISARPPLSLEFNSRQKIVWLPPLSPLSITRLHVDRLRNHQLLIRRSSPSTAGRRFKFNRGAGKNIYAKRQPPLGSHGTAASFTAGEVPVPPLRTVNSLRPSHQRIFCRIPFMNIWPSAQEAMESKRWRRRRSGARTVCTSGWPARRARLRVSAKP